MNKINKSLILFAKEEREDARRTLHVKILYVVFYTHTAIRAKNLPLILHEVAKLNAEHVGRVMACSRFLTTFCGLAWASAADKSKKWKSYALVELVGGLAILLLMGFWIPWKEAFFEDHEMASSLAKEIWQLPILLITMQCWVIGCTDIVEGTTIRHIKATSACANNSKQLSWGQYRARAWACFILVNLFLGFLFYKFLLIIPLAIVLPSSYLIAIVTALLAFPKTLNPKPAHSPSQIAAYQLEPPVSIASSSELSTSSDFGNDLKKLLALFSTSPRHIMFFMTIVLLGGIQGSLDTLLYVSLSRRFAEDDSNTSSKRSLYVISTFITAANLLPAIPLANVSKSLIKFKGSLFCLLLAALVHTIRCAIHSVLARFDIVGFLFLVPAEILSGVSIGLCVPAGVHFLTVEDSKSSKLTTVAAAAMAVWAAAWRGIGPCIFK